MTHSGCTWKTTVATPIEVRSMAAKNSAQLRIMSPPAAIAASQALRCSLSSRQRPVAKPHSVSASAPNAQRHHTVVSGSCPACSTKAPIVPSSRPPPIISHWPWRSRREGSSLLAGEEASAQEVDMPAILAGPRPPVKRIVQKANIRFPH